MENENRVSVIKKWSDFRKELTIKHKAPNGALCFMFSNDYQ